MLGLTGFMELKFYKSVSKINIYQMSIFFNTRGAFEFSLWLLTSSYTLKPRCHLKQNLAKYGYYTFKAMHFYSNKSMSDIVLSLANLVPLSVAHLIKTTDESNFLKIEKSSFKYSFFLLCRWLLCNTVANVAKNLSKSGLVKICYWVCSNLRKDGGKHLLIYKNFFKL